MVKRLFHVLWLFAAIWFGAWTYAALTNPYPIKPFDPIEAGAVPLTVTGEPVTKAREKELLQDAQIRATEYRNAQERWRNELISFLFLGCFGFIGVGILYYIISP